MSVAYEYRTVYLVEEYGLIPAEAIAKILNEQAGQGWRLVSVMPGDHGAPIAILERGRRLPEGPPDEFGGAGG